VINPLKFPFSRGTLNGSPLNKGQGLFIEERKFILDSKASLHPADEYQLINLSPTSP
jgi:hypothetical protein